MFRVVCISDEGLKLIFNRFDSLVLAREFCALMRSKRQGRFFWVEY